MSAPAKASVVAQLPFWRHGTVEQRRRIAAALRGEPVITGHDSGDVESNVIDFSTARRRSA
jgi:hypothetical protein